jgi:hypothetical protein
VFWAAKLEPNGQSTFAQVWAAGLLFFLANVAAVLALIRRHRFVPVFQDGALTRLPAEWWDRRQLCRLLRVGTPDSGALNAGKAA